MFQHMASSFHKVERFNAPQGQYGSICQDLIATLSILADMLA